MASFVLPIISGLAGLFGGGKQGSTSTSQQGSTSQTQNGNYNTFGSSTPNLNPYQQQLQKLFTQGASNNLNNSTNLSGYSNAGLAQIGQQGSANNQQISNALAARGLQYSPVAGNALAQNTINTGNQENSFLQSVPLLQTQLSQQALQQAMQAFSTQPYGTSTTGGGTNWGATTGSSQQYGTGSQYGDPLAGLFGGLGAGLAAPMNPGGAAGGGSVLSNILKGLGIGG